MGTPITKTILVLASNPADTARIRLDYEIREITEGLLRAPERDRFILQQVWAPRKKDLWRALLQHHPHIVHFCGHGVGLEGIVLEDEKGEAGLINGKALAQLLSLFTKNLECVVLNACYSEVQAKELVKYIPYVIGMRDSIKDTAAIAFAVALYDALGAGYNIEFAYKFARTAVPDDSSIPVLKKARFLAREKVRAQPILRSGAGPTRRTWITEVVSHREKDEYERFPKMDGQPGPQDVGANSRQPFEERPPTLSHPGLTQSIINAARRSLRPERSPERLFGREELLKSNRQRLLSDDLPILVYGAPGIGKTAFLRTLIDDPDIKRKYKDNIFWINLRENRLSTASEIANMLAKGLRFFDVLAENTPNIKLAALQTALSRELPDHILVLDNADLEQHEGELLKIYEQVTTKMIVGSRNKLTIRGTSTTLLRELDREYATQMFKFYAKIDEDDPVIGSICELVQYHPLAIFVAAPMPRVDSLALEELAENLKSKMLKTLSPVSATIALSYDRLGPEESYIFDSMGAFASSGAQFLAISEVTGLSVAECKLSTSRLQHRSLCERDKRDFDHVRLHRLLYEFARERLRDREDPICQNATTFSETPTGRMIRFYVDYSESHRDDFQALETARDNLIHAIELASQRREWNAVHDIWDASETWLDVTGALNTDRYFLELAENANRILGNRPIQLAKVLVCRSTYHEMVGWLELARKDAIESLELGRAAGHSETIANALTRLGTLYGIFGDTDAGHASLVEAWAICQNIPNWDESAYIAYQLGHSYWSRKDLKSATDMFEKAIAICKSASSPHYPTRRFEAYAVTALGNLLAEQPGGYEQAKRTLRMGLELKSGDQYPTAISWASLASLEFRMGNFEKGIELLRKAIKIYDKIGATSGLVRTLREIGDAYYNKGIDAEAVTAYEQARTIGLKTELFSELASALIGLCNTYYRLGMSRKALRALHERLEALAKLPKRDSQREGVTLQYMAEIRHELGDLEEALSFFEQAYEPLIEASDIEGAVRVLLEIGQVRSSVGNHGLALEAYEEAIEMTAKSEIRDARLKGDLLRKMGNETAFLKRYDESTDLFEQACDILRPVVGPTELAIVLDEFELVCKSGGRVDKAAAVHKELEEALAEASTSTDFDTLLELAFYHMMRNQLDSARGVLRRAGSLAEQLGTGEEKAERIERLADRLIRLGRAYERSEEYGEALVIYGEGVALLEAIGRPHLYGVVMHDIGDVHRAQDKPDQALVYYEKAAQFKKTDRVSSLRALGEVRSFLGQHEEALSAYKEALECVGADV